MTLLIIAIGVPGRDTRAAKWPPGRTAKSFIWIPSGMKGGQTFADGKFCEFGDAVNIQFSHNVPAVGLCGLDTDVEPIGYLPGQSTFGNQLEHLTFSARQGSES